MNDEIKEIYLSNLEWTKAHDNIGGVMGNLIFKDNIPYEEYQRLFKNTYFVLCNKDYITNLQQENENNKKAINLFKDDLANMTYQYAKEKEENEKLKKRNEEIYKGYMSVVDELTEYAEENERLKQANKILEENWKHYMMRCGKALDYVNNTSNFRLITLQNILQNGSEKDE